MRRVSAPRPCSGESSVTSGRRDQRLSPHGAAASVLVQLADETSPASSEGGGGRVCSRSPSKRSASSVRNEAGASSWFRSPAAATTAAVISTTPAPPSTRSTAWVWSALKSLSANARSSSTLLVNTGMSHCCHPAWPRTACAFPAAPSTRLRISSNTPARISLSSLFSKSRSRRPAAEAWTMPGTPEVDDPATGSSRVPLDS
mmetsp:Transcript_6173/g.23828  ORF Transcript_6173/g.23828 Transcript_6173/m.23828 type:complete len:202 (+) Transcript_6173:4013-4618(+)